TRFYVLHQREEQAVGDVWRQLHPLGNDFLFALVLGVTDLNLTCRSVDRSVHRLLERRTSEDKVVAQESECAALRKYGRVLIDRTIFETKYQMVGYAIALCVLRHLTIGEGLAFKRQHQKKAMDQTFRVAHRDHICESRVWLKHGGTGQQNRAQSGPGIKDSVHNLIVENVFMWPTSPISR